MAVAPQVKARAPQVKTTYRVPQVKTTYQHLPLNVPQSTLSFWGIPGVYADTKPTSMYTSEFLSNITKFLIPEMSDIIRHISLSFVFPVHPNHPRNTDYRVVLDLSSVPVEDSESYRNTPLVSTACTISPSNLIINTQFGVFIFYALLQRLPELLSPLRGNGDQGGTGQDIEPGSVAYRQAMSCIMDEIVIYSLVTCGLNTNRAPITFNFYAPAKWIFGLHQLTIYPGIYPYYLNYLLDMCRDITGNVEAILTESGEPGAVLEMLYFAYVVALNMANLPSSTLDKYHISQSEVVSLAQSADTQYCTLFRLVPPNPPTKVGRSLASDIYYFNQPRNSDSPVPYPHMVFEGMGPEGMGPVVAMHEVGSVINNVDQIAAIDPYYISNIVCQYENDLSQYFLHMYPDTNEGLNKLVKGMCGGSWGSTGDTGRPEEGDKTPPDPPQSPGSVPSTAPNHSAMSQSLMSALEHGGYMGLGAGNDNTCHRSDQDHWNALYSKHLPSIMRFSELLRHLRTSDSEFISDDGHDMDPEETALALMSRTLQMDPDIYIDTCKANFRSNVHIFLDTSGSMDNIISRAIDSVVIIAGALELLNVPWSFTTFPNRALMMYYSAKGEYVRLNDNVRLNDRHGETRSIKLPRDLFTAEIQRNISSIVASGGTPLESVFMAVTHPKGELEILPRDIVFFITDGEADSPCNEVTHYLQERNTISINIGLGIVPRIPITTESISIKGVDELPERVFTLLRKYIGF